MHNKTDGRKELEQLSLRYARYAVTDGEWSESQFEKLSKIVEGLSYITLLRWTRRGQVPLEINAD